MPSPSPLYRATEPALPQELVDMVINNLADDKRALSSCSTVCRSWQPTARTLLFRSVRLDAKSDKLPTKPHPEFKGIQLPDFEAFGEYFASSPAILSAVHDLQISGIDLPADRAEFFELEEFYPVDSDDEGDEESGEVEPSTSWTTLDSEVLRRVLRKLPRLKSLTLHSLVFLPTKPTEDHLYPLDSLLLDNAGTRFGGIFPVFDVVSPIRAKLRCFTLGVVTEPHPLPLGLETVTELDILGDPTAGSILGALGALKSPANITSFAIHVRDIFELMMLRKLLPVFGPTLKHLELDLHRAFNAGKPFTTLPGHVTAVLQLGLNLPEMIALHDFELNIRVSSDSMAGDILDVTSSLLLSLPRSVRRLSLWVDFVWVVPESVLVMPFNRLRGALENLSQLQLFKVHCSARSYVIAEQHREPYEKVLREAFSPFGNILELDFSRRKDLTDWEDR